MRKKVNPIDFETEKIENRPVYPPKPVGVALEINGKPRYLAWGHPTKNNCTKAEAKRYLRKAFKEDKCIFHHAAFDLEISKVHLGLAPPKDWEDTLFLAYLNDPREDDLSLKPLADKYLSMAPEEQTALYAWIQKNVYDPQGWKVTKKNPLGAHIAKAPGDLVGKYAKGDIIRTKKLYKLFMPDILERGMEGAYIREKLCMPVFEGMSRTGLCINAKKLKSDIKKYEKKKIEWEAWVRKRLRTPDLLISSGKQLADALDKCNKVSHWIMTDPTTNFPEGQRSTSRDNIVKVCTDKKLIEVLSRLGQLSTFMGTFMKPWLESAEKYGRVYPSFNQVRSTDSFGKGRGTRTGRPSSNNPNLLNVPKNVKDKELPNLREYIIPDPGCMFIIRDYSQQELRVLAHFEEGVLYEAYLANPKMDAHKLVGDIIKDILGIEYDRAHIKTVNFGMVYGMGVPGLAEKNNTSLEDSRELKKAHGIALPGVKELSKEIVRHAKAGKPIITWGKREYYVEEPKIIKGRLKDFYYKLLNVLIQGSSAECTKEAMIRADKPIKKIGGRLVLQVYDELAACVPIDLKDVGMKHLKDAMESIEFDIPMLTDGKTSLRSWGHCRKYKDKE